ncbi:MAG: helix-turn-helix domain-containing protein [Eubacteriales bacterium]|nr:helix-turn-helix domain-containing protein [Eubacteriales bacterium]
MDDIKIFENEAFGQVRTVTKENSLWFVAVDVCRALNITDPHVVNRRLEDDEKDRCLIPTHGGTQNMVIVNEPGLYSLVLASRKPEARAFKHWITHEVIPAIRRTGRYITPGAADTITIDPKTIALIVGATVREMMPYMNVGTMKQPVQVKAQPNKPKSDPKAFARKFQKLLKEHGMTCADASRLLNKPRTVIYYWFTGRYVPRTDNLQLIAEAFEIEMDYFEV